MEKPRVLVTGASKGIGAAIAQKLMREYSIIFHASKPDSLPEAPAGHFNLIANLSQPDELNELCTILKREHGEHLVAVINNAGITRDKSLIFQPEKDIDALLQVNLKAPIMICKTAMKIFHAKKRGTIINLGSCVGQTGNAFQAVYAACKAGLVALSKSLAKEAGALNREGHDIRVVSLSPGFIETDMTRLLPAEEKEKYLNLIPAARFGNPEDVASMAAFLLSDQASYVNGSNIEINGGML